MPELILLSFDRNEIIALNRPSRNGDAEANRFFETLWEPYREKALACFLCDAVVEFPVFSEIVGDLADANKAVGVPLCHQCGTLPKMVKWSRTMKMMCAMHKAKTGKNSVPNVRHIPRRR